MLSANDLAADHTAVNYTPTNANIDGHLSGIDTALASAGGGGGGFTYSSISSATTAVAQYHYSCDTSAAGFNLTLPAASGVTAGQEVRVKLVVAGNTLTIARSSTDLIDGQSSISLATQYQSLSFVSNGSDAWEII